MAAAAVIGDPLDPTTQVGPIASRPEYDKVVRYIDAGKASARLTAGGGTRQLNGKGLFVEPTVFADASNALPISREEIFGPVLPIIAFDTEDEAIRIANDTPVRPRRRHPDRRYGARAASCRSHQGGHGLAQHLAQIPSQRAVRRLQDERFRTRAGARGVGELYADQDDLGEPCNLPSLERNRHEPAEQQSGQPRQS